MKLNPEKYAQEEARHDDELRKDILDFERSNIQWSDSLAMVAKKLANYDGPCHYTLETDGIDQDVLFK